MQVTFPYDETDFPPVEIPDANLLGVFEPKAFEPVVDVGACVREAIENPIGSATVETLARGKRTALIISDDYTRQTPVDAIIPILEDKLRAAGVEEIRILVALGTHRAMTEQEKLTRFGADICARFEIIDHEYKNPDALVDMGTTARGTHFLVNRAALEADLVIGLGQIAPHRIAGYSGGSKIVLPGISGAEAIAHTHWIGGREDGEKMLGFAENPVREEMNACAAMAGLRFIVNAICDPEGRLIGMVAGDVIEAHLKGCELARDVFGVNVPEQADIVIADSFPKDIELWQAAKALYAADLMVKPGGVVILVSPCVEGVSRAHPLILERGYTSEDETLCEVESGQLTNLSVASHCLRVGRLIKDKATGIMVRNGIPREDQEHLGFISADTPEEALNKAFEIAGKDATIAVLRHGGEALPVMGTLKTLREVVARIESSGPISAETVRSWMRSPSVEVLGAVSHIVTYPPYWERITPPLDEEELAGFLFALYERCMREDPQGDWALSRYEATRELVGWFDAVPGDEDLGEQTFVLGLKKWLAELYRASAEDVREAIVCGALEHILEDPRWRPYFSDWHDDPALREAYLRAMEWAMAHER